MTPEQRQHTETLRAAMNAIHHELVRLLHDLPAKIIDVGSVTKYRVATVIKPTDDTGSRA
ncbi:MAG: hypothetical protein ACLP9Y_27505 [Mycobacterium sp.]|uniref:hypothetical protein n=1 Tax=Mycobacterium sp. TaxID=1785 RepID=UPI003F99FA94